MAIWCPKLSEDGPSVDLNSHSGIVVADILMEAALS